MVNKKVIVVVTLLLVAAVMVSAGLYPNYFNPEQKNLDSIVIGNAQSFECDTLVYLAQEQNFFLQNNLNVTIMNYTSGMGAVNDLLKGRLDIAATAEFPLVTQALNGANISALASIGKFQLQELIARKDHGISNVSDLAGKTIGVPLGTISQFYLGRFLELNGINLQNVKIININPTNALEEIVNGSIDAVVIWQPYAYAIESQLGSNAQVWSPQSSQALYILEVANNDWIRENFNVATRFIKALAQAENYYVNNPSKTEFFMQKGLNYTEGYMTRVWPNQQIVLSLDQSLVLAMADEARWLISNNFSNATSAPNLLNYINKSVLETVKPSAITVIG